MAGRSRPDQRGPWSGRLKWSRRKPALAGFVGVSILALVGLIGGGGYFTYRLSRALDVAERGQYAADMKLGEQAFENGRFTRVATLVEDHRPRPETGQADRRGFEWHYLRAVSDLELMTIRAHKGTATYLAFSPDSSALATCGLDGVVRLWDAPTGRLIREFLGHTELPKVVAFDPTGRRIASGGFDRVVRIWDVASGGVIRELPPMPQAVTGVSFRPPAGDRLAILSGDTTVRIDDLVTNRTLVSRRLPVPDPGRYLDNFPIFYMPGGRRLIATGGYKVFVLNAEDGADLQSFGGVVMSSLPFTPNGESLVLGQEDGLRLVETRTGAELFRVKGTTSRLASASIDGTGGLLAYTTGEGSPDIRLYDLPGRKELRALRAGTKGSSLVRCLALSPDGRILAAAIGDGSVQLWYNLRGRKASDAAVGPGQPRLEGLSLDASGRRLAVGIHDGQVALAEVEGPTMLPRRLAVPSARVYDVALSGDGRLVAAACSDGYVRTWDPAEPGEPPPLLAGKGQVFAVAFDPGGRRLAAAGDDRALRIWDLARPNSPLVVTEAHEGTIYDLAFSPDGRTLATASGDQTIRLRDSFSGHAIRTFALPKSLENTGPLNSVAFDASGRRVVAASAGGFAVVWDAGWGTLLATMSGHIGAVNDAAFSPDGRRVFTAGADGSVKLWDAELGTEVFEFRHNAPLSAVAMTPDGFRLLAASSDGAILSWDATPIVRIPGRGPGRPGE